MGTSRQGVVNTPVDQGVLAERSSYSRYLSLRMTPYGRAMCYIVRRFLYVTPMNGITSQFCLTTQMDVYISGPNFS